MLQQPVLYGPVLDEPVPQERVLYGPALDGLVPHEPAPREGAGLMTDAPGGPDLPDFAEPEWPFPAGPGHAAPSPAGMYPPPAAAYPLPPPGGYQAPSSSGGYQAPSSPGGYPPDEVPDAPTTRFPRVDDVMPPDPGWPADGGDTGRPGTAQRVGRHSASQPDADQPGAGQPGTERPGTDQPGQDQWGLDQRGPDQRGPSLDQAGPDQPSVGRHSVGQPRASGPSALRLVWIYPDLLSTYGDRGNLIMLARRASLRGIEVEALQINSDQAVPQQGDIYLLGGGEDLPQILAAERLRADGGLMAAAAAGAVVFAVCAGYQLVGAVFGGAQGEPVDGLGILDLHSGRGERRGVGEVVADVDPALGVDRLTGFENHQGVTRVGPAARPLARTITGVGNGDGTEGAYAGRVLGTYLHGPALVRNPGLADLLLSWVAGPLPPLPDATEAWTRQLRSERLSAVAG